MTCYTFEEDGINRRKGLPSGSPFCIAKKG